MNDPSGAFSPFGIKTVGFTVHDLPPTAGFLRDEHVRIRHELNLLARLHAALGEQRIDLTIERDTQRPFVRLARAQGVRL